MTLSAWSCGVCHVDGCVVCAQVDVTAEDSKAGPGEIPEVDPVAVKAAEPVSGVMGVAQRQFGAGWAVQDPWQAVRAGVAPVKPHKAQVGAGLDSTWADMKTLMTHMGAARRFLGMDIESAVQGA